MPVKRIGPKNWQATADCRNPSGERVRRLKGGFTSKAAAQEWERQTRGEIQGVSHTQVGRTPTLRQLHNEYMAQLETLGRSPCTIDYYENRAKQYLSALGDVRVTDITPLMVQNFINSLGVDANGNARRAETVRGYYRALRAELNYAEDMDVIDRTPCRGIRLPDPEPHEVTIYTGEELGRLLQTLSDLNHYLYWPVSFCVYNGFRRGEALGVRWQDIDFDTGILHVRGNLTVIKSGPIFKTTKTQSSDDDVALPEPFMDDLRALRKLRLAEGLYKPGPLEIDGYAPIDDLDAGEFVCLNHNNSRPIRPTTFDNALHSFQKRHGFPRSTIHDLRHTYGTSLIEAGVDVAIVSKAMRHSTIDITVNQYVASTTTIKRRATDVMQGLVEFPANTRDGDAGALFDLEDRKK